MIEANNPSLTSWISVPAGSDFPIQNLPFGIFSASDRSPRPGVAIGDLIVDLTVLAESGLLESTGLQVEDFRSDTLNSIMKHGKGGARKLRQRISVLLRSDNSEMQHLADKALVKQSEAEMHMPVSVGDYTDFYSSIDHATNVGIMFRDPENALLPNWKHIPVGYHGRASSIIPSGTPIHRPKGQTRPDAEAPPVFGPCRLLDFELEMAFVTFDGKPLGQSISTAEASDYIFWNGHFQRLVSSRYPEVGIHSSWPLLGKEFRFEYLYLDRDIRCTRTFPCSWSETRS